MDEPVNGARIAAQIIRRMKGANKERIVRAIQAANPSIAAKITANLTNFEEIAELTPQGIQILLKEIEHSDLVLSLKTASNSVQRSLLSNMSQRKRALVEDDFNSLPPTRKTEVEDAQRRILDKLDELRTSGLVRSGVEQDTYV